jgi:uncharacterized protein with NAD-binding domain and iron-sulfur cluster
VKRPGGKVAIVGGGMAGLAAAWRLSEPGWQDRFDSIIVYQRGWRLGGKGASSRGPNGRIEEHGLHIWLGSYENAFALLRECYGELDRARTDPDAPIQTWEQAMIPGDNLGLAELWGSEWTTWLGTFGRNDMLPGEPDSNGREMTAVGFVQRSVQLVIDFARTQREAQPIGVVLTTSSEPRPFGGLLETVQRAMLAAAMSLSVRAGPDSTPVTLLEHALDAVKNSLEYEHRPDHRRSWLLISLVTSVVRGILADKLVTDPRGFHSINDEDFGEWILRHGGHPDILEFPLVRGVYDLVFGYEDADSERPAVAAGVMIFLIGLVLYEYKGAIFWKMTAGMGDVIVAPIYQALRRRGVEFQFFHRLDALHLDERRHVVDAMTFGRQVRLREGIDVYEPLTTVRGLPVFPAAPLSDQLRIDTAEPRGGWQSMETHWAEHDDADILRLRRGTDFDHVVLAVSLGMMPVVAKELIADRPEWSEMTTHVRTIATQAFQIWLRPDERALGWPEPGVTISAYLRPFETWASMPQTLWAEAWPAGDEPGAVAYFCGSLDACWPSDEDKEGYALKYAQSVSVAAADYIDSNLGLFFPKAATDDGFAWHLLSGADNKRGTAALATQHVSVNIDPSDRYVQSVPGSDKYRLRSDESGYDNLVLAGDWTDCGMNAGCIEAAVMSGLQAANALLGRGRFHRIRGWYLP